MKILFIFPAYSPAWKLGGIVACSSHLCEALAREGIEVHVYTSNISGNVKPLDVPVNQVCERNGVQVTYFDATPNTNNIHHCPALIQALKQNIQQFDSVYVSAIWQKFGLEVMDLCHQANRPCVLGVHGSFSKVLRKKSWLKKTLYYHLCLKKRLKQLSAFHLTSQTEYTFAKDWVPRQKSFFVPNIINTDIFVYTEQARQAFRKKYAIESQEKVICSIGRPDWMKRVDLSIQALKKIHCKYMIITDTEHPITQEWMALAKDLGVDKKIIWTNSLPPEQIKEALAATDLFIHLSLNENFSMVVGEALSLGLPVITSKQVGIQDWLKDKEFARVIDLDLQELTLAIEDLLHRLPDFKRDHIRSFCVEHFSAQAVAKLFIEKVKAYL